MHISLPPLVGFCFFGERAIVLDARADRYWMLPDPLSHTLRRLCSNDGLTSVDGDNVANLVGMSLLDVVGWRPVAPCASRPVETSYLDEPTQTERSSTAIAWFGFVMAGRRLRTSGLGAALDHLEVARRRKCSSAKRDIGRHAAAFGRLRLFVSPNGRCLPLSLALATQCASVDVRLVFGVKLNPFAAHAWVQHGDAVLNDDVHVVRQFTPVLAI